MSYLSNLSYYAKIGVNAAFALEEIYSVKTKEDLFRWHKKWTPWFHDDILKHITDLEWKEKEAAENLFNSINEKNSSSQESFITCQETILDDNKEEEKKNLINKTIEEKKE
jgi:hypothetical protein